jgi:peptide/nickel transport system permease protein
MTTARRSPWMRDRRLPIAGTLIAILVILAAFAPLVAPYDPSAQPDIRAGRLHAPSLAHPFGTDDLSRDVLSRVVHGARISLGVALLAVTLSIVIGTAVGLVAGLSGGLVDGVLMRLVDAGLAIPRVFLLLAVIGLWGGVGVVSLVLILALTTWFDTSRVVRAEASSVRSREFVLASQALGLGRVRVALRHVVPNITAPIVVSATLGVGQILLIEAGLSYLGIGVRPPTPSWGAMIAEGQQWLEAGWWVALFPGLALVVTVLTFSLLGDALRDLADPRAR